MKNKTHRREFTSHAFEAEINVKRVRVKIVQITLASASSDGFKNVRTFLRKWNERTIQSFNGTWLIGAGVDRDELQLFGPGGTPNYPEACEIFHHPPPPCSQWIEDQEKTQVSFASKESIWCPLPEAAQHKLIN